MRLGIQAIEGATWDIFFKRLTDPAFVSLDNGFRFRAAPNGSMTKAILGETKFVDCEFFEIPVEDEMKFRSGIKRWISQVERENGRTDWVRFTPGAMTVKVEIFKGI